MTTPPNSEPPNEPPSREAVEAAMAFVQDIGQTQASAEWIKAIEVITEIAPDTTTAYTVARILAAEVQRLRAQIADMRDNWRNIRDGVYDYPEPVPPRQIINLDINGCVHCKQCGKHSRASLWFKGGWAALCPLCAAEFVCDAGRAG